jgi:hypothetical protein
MVFGALTAASASPERAKDAVSDAVIEPGALPYQKTIVPVALLVVLLETSAIQLGKSLIVSPAKGWRKNDESGSRFALR